MEMPVCPTEKSRTGLTRSAEKELSGSGMQEKTMQEKTIQDQTDSENSRPRHTEKSIEVRDLRKIYPLYGSRADKIREAFSLRGRSYHTPFEAIKGVSFSIAPGECVGIIGRNGSGKSTLLKILAGIIPPTQGQVRVRGRVSALLELGAGFNPEYTGMENIYLTGLLMGMTRQETGRHLQEILDFAGIGEFIHQPVRTYSSGMFVRLAFSLAVVLQPQILLIDEALSVGDVFFQQKCYARIREIAGRATVLLVSHDLNAVTRFCGRVLVLNRGVLVYDGPPRQAVTEYYRICQGSLDSLQDISADQEAEIEYETGQEAEIQLEDNRDREIWRRDIRPETKILREPPPEDGFFRRPDPSTLSGKMDIIIEAFYYSTEEGPFAEYCGPGSRIRVMMDLRSPRATDALIVGYQVRDRYGNEIFGQTSLTSGNNKTDLPAGHSRISFSFRWPAVREGDYFITLGVGEGYEVLRQTEQCWVNNAIHLTASSGGRLIYGIFNREMEDFEIGPGKGLGQ